MNLQPSANKNEDLLLKSLRHPDFYARTASSMETETGLSAEEILATAHRSHQMNVFTFKGETYVRLKEREAAYLQDAELGINPFEAGFLGEEYRQAMLEGGPGFPE